MGKISLFKDNYANELSFRAGSHERWKWWKWKGNRKKKKLFLSFWLRFSRASDSASHSCFWFTLDHNAPRTSDSDSASDSVASVNQHLMLGSHAKCVIENPLLKMDCPKVCRLSFHEKINFILTKKKIHLQPINVKGSYCLPFDDFEFYYIIMLMLFLNVPYKEMKVVLVLMRVFLTIMKQIWTKGMDIFCKWTGKCVIQVHVIIMTLLACQETSKGINKRSR